MPIQDEASISISDRAITLTSSKPIDEKLFREVLESISTALQEKIGCSLCSTSTVYSAPRKSIKGKKPSRHQPKPKIGVSHTISPVSQEVDERTFTMPGGKVFSTRDEEVYPIQRQQCIYGTVYITSELNEKNCQASESELEKVKKILKKGARGKSFCFLPGEYWRERPDQTCSGTSSFFPAGELRLSSGRSKSRAYTKVLDAEEGTGEKLHVVANFEPKPPWH